MTNEITLHVKVDLTIGEETAARLHDIADHLSACVCLLAHSLGSQPAGEPAPEQPADTATTATPTDNNNEALGSQAQEAAPEQPAPAEVVDDDVIDVTDDLPADDAPDPAPAKPKRAAKAKTTAPSEAPAAPAAAAQEIDNNTLFMAVKDAQKRGATAPAIREVFKTFGIASSRDCKPEDRPALLKALNSMNAA